MSGPPINWSWSPAAVADVEVDAVRVLGQLGGRFFNIPPYHDEPKLFHIASILPEEAKAKGLTRAGGSSWDYERAGIKALGETVERLSAIDTGDGLRPRRHSTFNALGSDALDPELYVLSRAKHRPEREDTITWVPGWRLGDRAACPSWIPAQLVFLPYDAAVDEIVWFPPTSNGLAAGQTVEHACWNAIMELLERDALLSFWLTGQPARRIDYAGDHDPARRRLHEISLQYQLDPQYYLLQSAVAGVFSVMCVLWDTTGIGPTVTLGLKTSHQLPQAMTGALEEAHQLRPWLRELQEQGDTAPPVVRTIEDRARWWISDDALPALEGRLANLDRVRSDHLTRDGNGISLGDLVSRLTDRGHATWLAELRRVVASHVSVRVIIPTLQPAYFDEAHPALLSRNDVNEPLAVPRHPLL